MIKVTIASIKHGGPYAVYKEDTDKPRSLKRVGIRQTLLGAQVLAANPNRMAKKHASVPIVGPHIFRMKNLAGAKMSCIIARVKS